MNRDHGRPNLVQSIYATLGFSMLWYALIYPPLHKTTGLSLDEYLNLYATARCRPKIKADNRVEAEGEDGLPKFTSDFALGSIPDMHGFCMTFAPES